MARFMLFALGFIGLLLNYLVYAESIEVSTSSSVASSTNDPSAAKSTDLEESDTFLNAVENYLTDGTKKAEPQTQVQGYVGQPMYPIYPAYNGAGYFYPGVNPNAIAPPNKDVQNTNYFSAVIPAAQAALQAGLKLFAKLGLFLVGGAGLLILGGIFTTIVCYITPVCTITFNGFDFQKALDKDTVRSLMTPEKIASAAALVQDAIGKYQRLQRAVGQ